MKFLIKEHKKNFITFFILVFLFYGNSLKNKYALDDEYVTVTNYPTPDKTYVPNNKLVAKGISGILEIWQSRYAHDEEYSFDYRPFTTTTFALEYSIFGQNPFISHLINVLIYALIICLIYINILSVFKDYNYKNSLAFLCSFVFLIMPSHTEAVDNIKCRDELLVLFFALTALYSAFKLNEGFTVKRLVWFILSMLFGLFCKKNAVITFALVPMFLFFYTSFSVKQIKKLGVIFVLVYLTHAIFENFLISEESVRVYHHFENPLYITDFSIIDKFLISLQTLGFYIKFYFIPFPFRAYYGFKTIDVYHPIDYNFLVAVLFVLFSIIFYMKTKNKHFLFAFLLFIGCISPFLNFFLPVAGIVGERLSFYSSFAFVLLIGAVIIQYKPNISFENLTSLLKKPYLYFIPIVLASFIVVVKRNSDWENQIHLFEKDIVYLKESAKGNSLLANQYFELLRKGITTKNGVDLKSKTLELYDQAITADSSFYSAYNNAGVVHFSFSNDVEKAKYYFILGFNHKEKYAQASENIGNCYKEEGDFTTAQKYYLKAIKFNPSQYRSYAAIIEMLFDNKKYTQTLNFLNIAKSKFPNDYFLHTTEANCYFLKGDTVLALTKFEEAYKLSGNVDLAKFIASKYLDIGDTLKYTLYRSKYLN